MNIGILIIGTRKYKSFFSNLYESFEKYVLTDDNKTYFYFTDDLSQIVPSNVKMFYIPPESWPLPTLMRYKYMLTAERELFHMDYLLYTDIDMLVINNIGRELVADKLLAVAHPGFYKKNIGTPETRLISNAYISPTEHREYYICGGIQGGKTEIYLHAIKTMNNMIQSDLAKQIIPIWNDESVWNRYYVSNQDLFTILSPEYCFPEGKYKFPQMQNYKTIESLFPKILALDKNHREFQT